MALDRAVLSLEYTWERVGVAKAKARGVCTYCGKVGRLSKDHIPPKNLFASPRPSTLVTVPCCRECNIEASKDDEYFRVALVLRHDTFDHPEAAAVFPAVLRSLKRPLRGGLRRAVLDGAKEIPHYSPAGVYLGQAAVYNVEIARIDRVVARMVRGFHWHHLGRRLDEAHEITTFTLSAIASDEGKRAAFTEIIQPLKSTPVHHILEGTFEYRFAAAIDDPLSTAWWFTAYGAEHFLGIATPLGQPAT